MDEKIADLKNAYRMSLIIGLAMVASVVINTLIVELMKRQGGFSGNSLPDETANLLRYIFLGVAAMDIFLIILLKRIMLGRKIADSPPAAPPPPSPAPFIGVYKMKGFNYPAPVQALLTSSIVTYTLCEAVLILGLALFFMAHKAADFYLFLALSLILFAVFFPRYSQWEALIKEREMDAMLTQGRI